jgi:hypothetical protein
MKIEVNCIRKEVKRWIRRNATTHEDKNTTADLEKALGDGQTFWLWSHAITTKSMIKTGFGVSHRLDRGTRLLQLVVQKTRALFMTKSRKNTMASHMEQEGHKSLKALLRAAVAKGREPDNE